MVVVEADDVRVVVVVVVVVVGNAAGSARSQALAWTLVACG